MADTESSRDSARKGIPVQVREGALVRNLRNRETSELEIGEWYFFPVSGKFLSRFVCDEISFKNERFHKSLSQGEPFLVIGSDSFWLKILTATNEVGWIMQGEQVEPYL